MELIRHPSQRVAVLIDVQNFYHSAKNLYQKRVNFKEVLKTAVGNRQLVRAFGYVVSTESGEEQDFFDVLQKMGIEIRVKELQIYYGGLKKADWDVGIAIDGVRLSNMVDVIILMSGDGDFVPLVEYLKNKGTQVEVMAFGKSASTKLREAADGFIDLCESPDKYLLGGRRKKRKGKK
ncbi:MAG: NYN domain-containing protein [Candidatus Spechtbacterales bacterium]|nr:NYN domain-containing protein [Candidatus Spechtbacterales bacterium]